MTYLICSKCSKPATATATGREERGCLDFIAALGCATVAAALMLAIAAFEIGKFFMG